VKQTLRIYRILSNNRFQKIFRYWAIFVIGFSILSNMFFAIIQKDYFYFISLRNLYLFVFLACFFIYNKWSLGLLIFFNIYFWYFFLTTKILDPHYIYKAVLDDPVLDFSRTTHGLFKNRYLKLILMILLEPFILHFLISAYEIPRRIFVKKG